MSGVFGYCKEYPVEPVEAIVARMGQTLCHLPHHRVDHAAPHPSASIGRHTIGILNQEPQPIRSPDGRVWLWMCGEFYHQEQRRAMLISAGMLAPDAPDAMLALQTYLRDDVAGLTRLGGAFTLAIWDDRTAELLIINDRFALYPHYYAQVGDTFAFAPEIKGVLAASGIPHRLSNVAIAQYVRFQQMLGETTWFEDIRVLPAATVLRYRPADHQLTLRRYWHPSAITENPRITFNEAVEEANRLFQRAVDARLGGSKRLGVYLSGGMDGRMILSYIGGQTPVTTITFGEANCRDVVYAAELARRAGTHHHWFPLTNGKWVLENAPLHLALTEGQHSWMHAHGISTMAAARKIIDVDLTGWEGEMTLGGLLIGDDYAHDRFYRNPPSESDFVQRMYEAFCTRMTWPGLNEAEAFSLFGVQGNTQLRSLAFDSLAEELARTRDYPAQRRADYFSIEQHVRRSLQYQIVFARAFIEVRCPFFDDDLFAFVFSLPLAIHANPQFRRAMITRQMPKLAMVPYDHDNQLPHSGRITRWKHGSLQRAKNVINRRVAPIFPDRPRLYADYEQYLRTDLRTWAEHILFDRQTRERGLFNPKVVRALWERHITGQELWTIGKIAPLMTIELVLRAFFDNNPATASLPSQFQYHQ